MDTDKRKKQRPPEIVQKIGIIVGWETRRKAPFIEGEIKEKVTEAFTNACEGKGWEINFEKSVIGPDRIFLIMEIDTLTPIDEVVGELKKATTFAKSMTAINLPSCWTRDYFASSSPSSTNLMEEEAKFENYMNTRKKI
ncbi:MAG: transposase [Bacteroidales bacterium]